MRLLPVTRVLTANQLVRFQRAHGLEDLGLLVLDSAKIPAGRRRLHREQRHNLEHVVLNHVTQTAGRL